MKRRLKPLKDITQQINLFRKVLIFSWPFVKNIIDNHDWNNDPYLVNDWIQVNWELLIERELLGRHQWSTPLSPSGYRILNRNSKPTYTITTLLDQSIPDLQTGKLLACEQHLRLVGFCTTLDWGKGKYGLFPPFDAVHLIDDSKRTKEILTAPFASLSFFLNVYKFIT